MGDSGAHPVKGNRMYFITPGTHIHCLTKAFDSNKLGTKGFQLLPPAWQVFAARKEDTLALYALKVIDTRRRKAKVSTAGPQPRATPTLPKVSPAKATQTTSVPKTLPLATLRTKFHKPAEEAARELGVSVPVRA